jgi:hypothetical protein
MTESAEFGALLKVKSIVFFTRDHEGSEHQQATVLLLVYFLGPLR